MSAADVSWPLDAVRCSPSGHFCTTDGDRPSPPACCVVTVTPELAGEWLAASPNATGGPVVLLDPSGVVEQAFQAERESEGPDAAAIVVDAAGRVVHGADVLRDIRRPTSIVVLIEGPHDGVVATSALS